jgi:putative endonuclease
MYWVYILASAKHGTLYIGVTNDLIRRVYQQKNKLIKGFSSRYGVVLLVWFEGYDDPTSATTGEGVEKVAPRVEGQSYREGQSELG